MQNFRRLGAPPPDPPASDGWGLCPRPPKQPHYCYAPDHSQAWTGEAPFERSWCSNAKVAWNRKVENLWTTISCIHFKRSISFSYQEPRLRKHFFMFAHHENFMCPAWVVKKFEFWRARLGQTRIVASPIFATFSLFLISTHFKNLIYLALTI